MTTKTEANAETGRLLEMIGASWMSQTICVAAELRIADLLENGRKNIDDLARATRCQRASLHRLMRALASLGLCAEHAEEFFELTAAGSLLATDARPSVRSWAIWWGRYQWPVWGNLLYSVKTGGSARKLVTGDGYAHLECDPKAASIFNRAMVELTQLVADEVARVYDFSEARRLVDVGGGYGELLTALLAAYPALHGVLVDLPHAIDGAAARIAHVGVAQRCELVAGNFFDSVPGGGDVYLLKSVLHNWDDGQSSVILGNCRRAMSEKSKLVLVERIMPARMRGSADERAIVRTDLNMLVGLGGRERTEPEFAALLASSGFKAARVLPTTVDFSVIEGVPE
jgi:orsellinic acid C2-O-methyltransferase